MWNTMRAQENAEDNYLLTLAFYLRTWEAQKVLASRFTAWIAALGKGKTPKLHITVTSPAAHG